MHARHILLAAVSTVLAASCSGESTDLQTQPRQDEAAPVDYVQSVLHRNGETTTTAGGDGRIGALYQVGSIAKYACTLAAMKLQHSGSLSLDDTVQELLPVYSGPHGDRITLLHLLQNRSGLKDEVIAALEADPSLAEHSMSAVDAANRFAAGEVHEPPGTRFDYVNSNWILVQAILEHVGRAPIADLLETLVFDPAEMQQTRVFSGGLPGEEAIQPSTPVLGIPNFVSCAGGLASTPEDLIRLLRHPYRNAGLNSSELATLSTVYSPTENYALGGRLKRLDANRDGRFLSWQSGSNGAFKSLAAYDPVQDIGFAIVTNSDAEAAIARHRDAWVTSEVMGD